MSWQYRILRDYDGETPVYSIVERYEPGAGAYCDASVGGWGSIEELRSTLELMLRAFDLPVLALEGGHIIELPVESAVYSQTSKPWVERFVGRLH